MKFIFEQFTKEQNAPAKPVVTADLTGKTVLVLGGNTGLGREAARHMASMNAARVILGCRSVEKGNAAADGTAHPLIFSKYPQIFDLFVTAADIKKSTGNPNVEVFTVDLLKLSSVTDFANHVKKNVERLDYVFLNAGLGIDYYTESEEGTEARWLSFPLLCTCTLIEQDS